MISRGQIHLLNLNPVQGREQKGTRPVLVVSADAINRQPLVVTVVAGTDATNLPRDYPTNVRVPARESGLPKDTVFLCFQLRALDPMRFQDPRHRSDYAGGSASGGAHGRGRHGATHRAELVGAESLHRGRSQRPQREPLMQERPAFLCVLGALCSTATRETN